MDDNKTQLVSEAINSVLSAQKLISAMSIMKKAAIAATLAYVAVTAVKVFRE